MASANDLPTSGVRKQLSGELKPASIAQSSTRNGDVDEYGAHRAVDSNLDTMSCTETGSGKWLQAKLDTVHCVRHVMWYFRSDTPATTWTCDQSGCICDGSYCSWASLNVGNEARAAGDRTDCRYGDNIKLTFSETFMVAFSELSISEIPGNVFFLSQWFLSTKYSITLFRKKKHGQEIQISTLQLY